MKCLQGEISEKDGMINKERQVHQQGPVSEGTYKPPSPRSLHAAKSEEPTWQKERTNSQRCQISTQALWYVPPSTEKQ